MENSEKKVFRSLIKKYFSIELMIELVKITESYDIDNNTKGKEITKVLTQYGVPYSPLGSGTNRYGVLIDGYAVKIALDKAGKIDNRREFKYTDILQPYVVKVYECCEDGLIAVSEYVTIFSLDDFYDYQDEMRKILGDISQKFLVGDIGVSTNNYVNWGMRLDKSICILDFAYIYTLSYKSFKCTCDDEGILEFDNDYNYLICPYCRKKYSFADIRRTITKDDEEAEIGNIMDIGYHLTKAEEELEVNPCFTKSTDDKKEKKEKKKKEKIPKIKQDWDLEEDDQSKLMDDINRLI